MPLYFFHRRNAGTSKDEIGTDLPNLASARREAVLFAAETLRDRPEWAWTDDGLCIEVADAHGKSLLTVHIATHLLEKATRF